MKRRVVFTQPAQRQLFNLHDYITDKSSKIRADGYLNRIVEYCRKLDQFPIRGAARDDLLAGLRTTGFERRVTIAFVVTEKAVLIEGVFYGGRNLEAFFHA